MSVDLKKDYINLGRIHIAQLEDSKKFKLVILEEGCLYELDVTMDSRGHGKIKLNPIENENMLYHISLADVLFDFHHHSDEQYLKSSKVGPYLIKSWRSELERARVQELLSQVDYSQHSILNETRAFSKVLRNEFLKALLVVYSVQLDSKLYKESFERDK